MQNRVIPQFLIAAPTSGCGKTTVARGIMAVLAQRGMKVQPFKCGPDYIDTKFHTSVCNGRASVNLDTFMASGSHVRELYAHYGSDADVCVLEGMMGMFDGYDRSRGSSAEIAGLLDLPVILVVDARSSAYSVAALINGYDTFDPRVHLAGVLFNKVGSASHAAILREACADTGVECFGCIPKDDSLDVNERYLGLDVREDKLESKDKLHLETIIRENIDFDALLQKCTCPFTPWNGNDGKIAFQEGTNWNIVVARNKESFTFIYQEHLDILQGMGRVTFIDPESDHEIPQETDLLYLPGGYPEKNMEVLCKNHALLKSVADYAESGGRILGECGGMIYLSNTVRQRGSQMRMTGVLPIDIDAENCKLKLGYRQFEYNGQLLRGHEFHYTQMAQTALSSVVQVYSAKGRPVDTPIFRYKNVIASYTHLYWGEIDLLKLFGE